MRSPTRTLIDPSRPVIADCRFSCERRMGIGDKVVVVGALQALAAAGFDVRARWNDGDDWLFFASGIREWTGEAGALLPMRGHCMEIPVAATQEDADTADLSAPHPVWRVLWNHGLEEYAPPTPDVRLFPSLRSGWRAPLWFPIEVSRARNPIPPEAWERPLVELADTYGPAIACCAPGQFRAASEILSRLSRRARGCVKEGLSCPGGPGDLLSAIAAAPHVLTGNSGPMWLAMATRTPLTVLQRPADTPHAAMWNARPGWSPLLRLVQI